MENRMDPWWAKAYDQMRELKFYYHYVDFRYAQLEVPFIEAALSLEPMAQVLDLGCGNGRHAILLAKKGYRVTGIDYSQGALEMARERDPNQGQSIW